MNNKPDRRIRRGITRVLEEVRRNRYYQIVKGYTPEHDDNHSPDFLAGVIAQGYIDAAVCAFKGDPADREHLIDAITVLVATVESMDRKAAR